MKRKEIEQKIIDKANNDQQFKLDLINNPKQILQKEFGLELPGNISVAVLEEKPDKFYLVLPLDKTKIELSDDMLDNVAGGCCGPCGYEDGKEPKPAY